MLATDTTLSGLIGSGGFRDRLASGQQLPCLVLSDLVTNDFSTATEPGEEHLLTLQVWSQADGQRQAQAMAGRVRVLLHDAEPALAAATLVNLQHVSTRTRREPKTRLFCAEMRFRAVTE